MNCNRKAVFDSKGNIYGGSNYYFKYLKSQRSKITFPSLVKIIVSYYFFFNVHVNLTQRNEFGLLFLPTFKIKGKSEIKPIREYLSLKHSRYVQLQECLDYFWWNKYLLNTYDMPCVMLDETDLESNKNISSIFNYLTVQQKRKACKQWNAMTCCTLVLYLLEMGRTNDILPSAILWYIEKTGSNMYVTGQTAVTWVSPFPQWTEKIEMQNSNRSQTIWFYHILIKGKDQNLLKVLAWRFGKRWSIGFMNTGKMCGADIWERNRKGGEFLFYDIYA